MFDRSTRFLFLIQDSIPYRLDTVVNACSFFFSSRRRHTRLVRDWSSDVCSSDLFCLRSEENKYELELLINIVCRLMLEKKRTEIRNQINEQDIIRNVG